MSMKEKLFGRNPVQLACNTVSLIHCVGSSNKALIT